MYVIAVKFNLSLSQNNFRNFLWKQKLFSSSKKAKFPRLVIMEPYLFLIIFPNLSNILWHMGRIYSNIGMSVNVLMATNTSNIRRTAVSMRRPVNAPLKNVTTIKGKLYSLCGPPQVNALNNRTSTARQRSCKQASLTKEGRVFRGVRAEDLSWRQSALESVSSR
jgi:hypothetical protein